MMNHKAHDDTHPENDPELKIQLPPEILQQFEDFDPLLDPLYRLEVHRRSTIQAMVFALVIPAVTLATALAIAFVSRGIGGPLCEAGLATWLCTRTAQIVFPVVPGLIALGGTITAALITYFKWARYNRWRPWLAIIWFLMPFSLFWIVSTGTILILGHDLNQ